MILRPEASWPGHSPLVSEDESLVSLSLLELKLHVREFQGKIPASISSVSWEQMTSGVCPASLSALVLSGLWDVFDPCSCQELSERSLLGCGVQLLLGSPREENKSGMEVGKAQSLMLSRAFSPELIPQKEELRRHPCASGSSASRRSWVLCCGSELLNSTVSCPWCLGVTT